MPFNFLPKNEHYFVLLKDAANNIHDAALQLQDLVENFEDVEEKAAQIRTCEERGDEITFQVISRLSKTFVTPLEREDLFTIARALDDVVDLIDASASRLVSYNIGEPTEASREFARLIADGAKNLAMVLEVFHHQDVERIRVAKSAINRVESEADKLLRRVVAALFTPGTDPLNVIKWKEIYETLEMVTDKMEGLANLLEGIIVKNT